MSGDATVSVLKDGRLDQSVFSPETYEREMELVFGRAWQFVGHASMIPNNGDYHSLYMGEDPIIVARGEDGDVHVLLNKCRHRGNRVCLFDRGNTRSFTCSYHGWAYTTDGTLKAVPFLADTYGDSFRKDDWGLVPAAKVEQYLGLIFATWDPEAPDLRSYLGDVAWYLDYLMADEIIGGLEVVEGIQRYRMPGNWKLLAENFAGDQSHVMVTHASVLHVRAAEVDPRLGVLPGRDVRAKGASYAAACNYETGAPHGLLELRVGDAYFQHDLAQARLIGEDATEWVRWRNEQRSARLRDAGVDPIPYGFHIGNIFPNLSVVGLGTALDGVGLLLWLPRGPYETEVWQWCAVNRDAPPEVRRRQREVLMEQQSAAGVFAPDDHENFERIASNLRTTQARRYEMSYEMGQDLDPVGHVGWPGHVMQSMSETNQREFYRYWEQLMTASRA